MKQVLKTRQITDGNITAIKLRATNVYKNVYKT